MKKKETSKMALLADRRQKNEDKAAQNRGAITLNKRHRREISGLRAWEREIQVAAAPFQEAIREFMAEVQEEYGVILNVTHNLDFQNCELIPVPEKKEPDQSKVPQEQA